MSAGVEIAVLLQVGAAPASGIEPTMSPAAVEASNVTAPSSTPLKVPDRRMLSDMVARFPLCVGRPDRDGREAATT